jgi:hypothetical protein
VDSIVTVKDKPNKLSSAREDHCPEYMATYLPYTFALLHTDTSLAKYYP